MGRIPDSKGVPGLFQANTSCSYIEGIIRGYRNGLLSGSNYANMTQCETIDGNTTLNIQHAIMY